MPPSDDTGLISRSLAFLDWPDLLAALADQARSSRGAALCRAVPLARNPAEARAAMAEVEEMAGILRGGRDLPGFGFPEIEPFLAAAEKGVLLGAEELQQVATCCEIASGARRFFEARSSAAGTGLPETPLLWTIAASLDPREEIAVRVRSTFDAQGEVRDSVSPELARLRRERGELSSRVRDEIEVLMRSEEFAPVLQDQFFTLRADRYVLPLKASAKSMGLGIVHDTSRTGETVFVEPTSVVNLNNRLKVAELEILRQVRQILEEISKRVAAAAPAMRANLETLTRMDVAGAKARVSVAWEGTLPAIVDEPRLDLKRARHPLLVLRGARENFPVTGNSFLLGGTGAAKVLVITGPNAGGKTVLLKTAGLTALLVRAGMLPPVDADSVVGFFDPVLADIGDQQSVMGDLSTFSAHLANLSAILQQAGDRALVLVDELMVGTNPEQGAALARATLESLADLGGLTVTTTHYDSLKALAQGDARFRNAAMEYDLDDLRPTFRLRDGVPGRSYALDIAQRMGLPKDVLDRARALAGAQTVGLEEVIAKLEARELGLAKEAEALLRARAEVEATAGDQRAAAEALTKRERELARNSRVAIEEAVREAREAIRAIVRQAQAAGSDSRAAEAARRALDVTAVAVTKDLPEEPPPPGAAPATLVAGETVFVPSLKSDAVIVKAPNAKGRVKVAVGALTFDVEKSELRVPKKPPAAKDKQRPRGTEPEPAASTEYSMPTSSNTVDLRGMRADAAVTEVESFLDRASLAGRSPVFVLHGHGTGALKRVVREYLARSPYVRAWRPGAQSQGGDGVSVVDL